MIDAARTEMAMTTQAASASVLAAGVIPSHLIHNVSDTDATIRFYKALFGSDASDDMEIATPALDSLFGRKGVRIRSTFIEAGGYRLHTIETLDKPRTAGTGGASSFTGVSGLSWRVKNLDDFHAAVTEAGFTPTEIYSFELDTPEHSARMFFLDDPDGLRCELVEQP
jgi:catechol 2,3-dioxygenase-like lactoylglutathione lyase family enzyme